MTNKEIRTEIERFRKTNKVSEDKEYAQYELDVKCGYDMALDDMLSYINSLSEEPVSEDLEKAADSYIKTHGEILGFGKQTFKAGAKWQKEKDESATKDLGEYITELSKQFPEVSFAKLSRIAVRVAKWQKQQDQSTIELAEDHAMLAGMEKMKEQMMKNAVDATICLPYENNDGGYTHLVDVSRPLPVGDNKIAIIFKEE